MRTTPPALGFLLACAAGLACGTADSDTDAGSATTGTGTSNGSGSTASGSTPGTSSTGAEVDAGLESTSPATSTTSDPDTTADAGGTGLDSGSATASSESGPPPSNCQTDPIPDVCQAAHDHWVVCVYGKPITDESYLYDCACRLELADFKAGPTCVELLEDWYACVATAPCMEIILDEHCPDPLDAIQAECPSLSPA